MIKHLKIENFKSIRQLEIDCKRLNILIGEPNSGKSNFLESLRIFAYAYTFDNVGKRIELRNLARLEKMPELFFDQEITNPVKVETDEQSLEIQVGTDPSSPYIFILFEKGAELSRLKFQDDGTSSDTDTLRFSSIRPYYFHPIPWTVNRPGSFLWPPYGDNLLPILMTNEEVRDMAGDLTQKYGMELVLKPREYRIELQKRKKGVAVSWPFRSLSDTLQRLIFYFAAIETNKEATLLLEEPESHAFPYYTKFLGETIARDSSNQYFIATHNPYFLFSIIEKAPKEDLNVLITHLENEETRIKQLDEKGIEKAFDFDSSIFFNLEELINE